MRYGGTVSALAAVLAVVGVLLASGCRGEPGADQPAGADQSTVVTQTSSGPGRHQLTLASGGQERSYLLDVPDGFRPDEPTPLVLVLHAGRSTAREIRGNSRMESFAQEHGVLVAYPRGVKRFWRPVLEGEHGIGVELGGDPADVDFLRDLVAHLVREWGVAPGQVYATGHSNGAAMTYRLAAEAADVFAAIAPVGGYLFEPPATIEPAEPVSVVGFVGLAADAAPEIAAGLDTWRDRLGCQPGQPEPTGDERVTRTAASCRDGSEVVEYAIEGMPHVWPSPAHGIDVNQVIWEFFAAHARSG